MQDIVLVRDQETLDAEAQGGYGDREAFGIPMRLADPRPGSHLRIRQRPLIARWAHSEKIQVGLESHPHPFVHGWDREGFDGGTHRQ